MPLLDTIVAYYRLDGNSTDSISNTSGSDTAITYSAANGYIGQGAGFNGTSSKIVVGAVSTYSFIQNTGIFTISFWAKRTSIGALVYPIGNTQTSNEKGFFVLFNADNSIQIAIVRGGGGVISNVTASSFFTDTNWNLITITGNGTSIKFYKNTTAFTPSNTMGSLSSGDSTRTLTIGTLSGAGAPFYNGTMDMIGIWNRDLSSTEITELYSAGQYPFSTNFLTMF